VRFTGRSARRLITAGPYPSRAVGPVSDRGETGAEQVVVFVKAPASPSVAPMRVAIHQQDEAFHPRVVAVTAGSTVEFPNDDVIFHNVFSLSGGATFDLGRYPKGESRARRFTSPGLVKVFCHFHSHMTAMVRVFDHPYFAVPDHEGRFSIAGLAPAHYDVVAWHERVGEVTERVAVAQGEVANVTFSLPLVDPR
jgi:plastocyanin